ncbi:MAG: 1-deoxy-D-xylulose-5-phosphate reductoisomerase [bacterium]|nr:1-deoxy-D-xylulose-5-phosphate reductoisomerase [bacterium]
MKKIVILGSTGSIGKSTIEVLRNLKDKFEIYGLAANNNISLLAEQAKEFNCKKIVCNNKLKNKIQKNLPEDCKIMSGIEGMIELSTVPEVDIVLCAVVGTAALLPVIEAIKKKKNIAIASKEILVMAGELIMTEARKNNIKMLPVDSEHSAIFQCLDGKNRSDISKIILTASGGTFRTASLKEMENATYQEALAHPTWNMGPKVTIDSATLMNKALEIIEAYWLFDIPPEKIDVVVHPQSIIHSMVEFIDGTILAQMSVTDMKFPIQHALTYPEKIGGLKSLSFADITTFTFEKPDRERFPSLDIAVDAIKKGGTMPAVMNAANEIAVERFSRGEISLLNIWDIIKKVMSFHEVINNPSLEEIISADNWAKQEAYELVVTN